MGQAKFVIRRSDKQYFFHLAAPNGEIILNSQLYASRASVEHSIAAVKTNARVEERFERRTSGTDQPYFVLKAGNGDVIGTSQVYSSSPAMENGIASVQTNAATAGIET